MFVFPKVRCSLLNFEFAILRMVSVSKLGCSSLNVPMFQIAAVSCSSWDCLAVNTFVYFLELYSGFDFRCSGCLDVLL